MLNLIFFSSSIDGFSIRVEITKLEKQRVGLLNVNTSYHIDDIDHENPPEDAMFSKLPSN